VRILADTVVFFIQNNPLILLVVGVSLLLVLLTMTVAQPNDSYTHLAAQRNSRRHIE